MSEIRKARVTRLAAPQFLMSLIDQAAERLTGGNKTGVVGLAVRRLLDEDARAGSLFGAHPRSVRIADGVDLIAPILDVEPDAASGMEIDR